MDLNAETLALWKNSLELGKLMGHYLQLSCQINSDENTVRPPSIMKIAENQ